MEEAARRLKPLLGDGARTRDELLALVGDSARANGIGLWLDLVRVPPSGTWERRRADLFAAAESWLGPGHVTPEEGVTLLVKRYLGGFGPARPADIASWAGLPVTPVQEAVARLRLRTLRDEEGKRLVDLPRSPLPPAETPAPARFLGVWEAALLVHARRTQILPERFRPIVFNTKTPHSVATFLVDGAVAGKWRTERTARAATLVLEPFARLPRAAEPGLRDEGERLVRFVEPDATSYAVRVSRG